MTRVKISKYSIVISLTCLLLISSPYIQQTYNNLIKACLEAAVIIFLVVDDCMYKSDKKILTIPLVFSFLTCFSTFRWSGFSTRLLNNIVTIGSYVTFFLVFNYCLKRIDPSRVINSIKHNILFYTCVLDFFVLVTWGKGLGGMDEAVYLLGNKFITSYMHMAYFALLFFSGKKYKEDKKVVLAYWVYSLVICKIADCTTGMIGISVLMFLMFISERKDRIYNVLKRPILFVACLIIPNILLLLTDILTSSKFFSNFFLKYSHTNTMLSGRLTMYQIVLKSIEENWVWGYGINYDVVYQKLGFGNPQNGLLKILLDYGVVGTVCFVILACFALYNLKKVDYIQLKGPLFFIYAMLICSLVEINFNALFYMFLAIITVFAYAKRRKSSLT